MRSLTPLFCLTIALACAAPASAQVAAPPKISNIPVVEAPAVPNVTIVAPADAELAKAYPDVALGKNTNGQVILSCKIRADSTLGCYLQQWTPPYFGFENAALQIAAMLRVQPNDKNSYVGQMLSVKVRFPASPADAASQPVPTVASAPTAYLPAPLVRSPNAPPAPMELPHLVPHDGKAYVIDKSNEPWVVTFYLIDSGRIRSCNNSDPVVSQAQINPGTTMKVADGQKIELYVNWLSTWSPVAEADRCPNDPARAQIK